MYITLNFWLGGKKWQKGNICVGTEKRGQMVGKSSFFNLDLIKSNGRVLVAFLMFGAESRICSFEKETIFFYYDFDCGLFSFFLRSWTIILLLGRKQPLLMSAVLSIMFVKSNFFVCV